jgi:hypothetical protein
MVATPVVLAEKRQETAEHPDIELGLSPAVPACYPMDHITRAWRASDNRITPDGRRAVSASWDKTLKVWDLERPGNRIDTEADKCLYPGH